MMIDLVQLRTFVAVAEELHLTRAAERIHISQSAASTHIRAVEDALRTQLFVRTKRRLALTQAGQLLLGRAKALLNEATLFTSFAHELQKDLDGVLVIGSSVDPQQSRLKQVMATIRAKHELVKIDLRARPSFGTKQGLQTGELDIGLMLELELDANFKYYELTRVPHRVAGPIKWKKQIETGDLATLATLPWITPAYSSMAYATMLAQIFGSKSVELNSAICFDNSVHMQVVSESDAGMMLMLEEYAHKGVAEGYLAVSPLVRPVYPLYFMHLASRINDPLIRAFIAAAKSVWPQITT